MFFQFFFDQEKCEITFEVSKDQKVNFDLALEKLGKTKEEVFDAFLSTLIAKALSQEKEMDFLAESKEEPKKLSSETVVSRINRWVERVHSYPHMMVQAFLMSDRSLRDDDSVPLLKMHDHFNYIAGLPADDEAKFISIFRQMCSASATAYGNVFRYDRKEKTVRLNEEYKDVIYAHKDKFLRPED